MGLQDFILNECKKRDVTQNMIWEISFARGYCYTKQSIKTKTYELIDIDLIFVVGKYDRQNVYCITQKGIDFLDRPKKVIEF